MSIHQTLPFVTWVKAVLVAGGVAADVLNKPATIPAGQGYTVIYPIAGGVTDGSIDAPLSDASPNVQITSFSTNRDQAMWLSDKVRTLLAASVPAVLAGGRKAIWLDFATASPTLTRDDDVQPPLYVGIDVFEVGTA